MISQDPYVELVLRQEAEELMGRALTVYKMLEEEMSALQDGEEDEVSIYIRAIVQEKMPEWGNYQTFEKQMALQQALSNQQNAVALGQVPVPSFGGLASSLFGATR
tara:strand:+ start:5865 stop:6182 length:318 start_codon:yes stop_codon:yes gene_type:complete